jgi:hypothetical protein
MGDSSCKNYLHGGKEIYILPEEFDSVPRFIVAGILQKKLNVSEGYISLG